MHPGFSLIIVCLYSLRLTPANPGSTFSAPAEPMFSYPSMLYFNYVHYYFQGSTDALVRLSNGDHGIVQVYYDGQYGTVCDDTFGDNDVGCTIVCRELGFR